MNIDFQARVADLLDHSDDYRVLRRLTISDAPPIDFPLDYPLGLAIDVETTGLNPATDQIIELGARLFHWNADFEIDAVGPLMCWRQDPGRPLPEKIIQLTGLTDADLAGCAIDVAAFAAMVESAQFIIAHNAAFDRPFIERLMGRPYPWLCSLADIDWTAQGAEIKTLSGLLMEFGYFRDQQAHRAGADVDALIGLLRQPLRAGRTALAEAFAHGSQATIRVEATGAAFEMRHRLRDRGYRWRAAKKVWQKEVASEEADAERAWLLEHVYADGGWWAPHLAEVTWLTRHME